MTAVRGTPYPDVDRRPFRNREPELIAIHVGLTGVMGALAVSLSLPGDVFPTSRAWNEFAKFASEDVWAIAFWVATLVGTIGVDTRRLWLRQASVIALALAHFCTAALFMSGSSTGGLLFVVIALLGWFLEWRIVTLARRGLL